MKHLYGLFFSLLALLCFTSCASAPPLTVGELDKVSVGGHVMFGKYEQDNDLTNGEEDIEWIVLAQENDKILMVSKYALECRPAHLEAKVYVVWEGYDLREWLNSTFLEKAFSENEQSMVLQANVAADKNPEYDTNPGNDTQDKVFLLSASEVNKYFASKNQKRCKATAYCEAQGAYIGKNRNCIWWLRTPGRVGGLFVITLDDGAFNTTGWFADQDDYLAVRPAIWIRTTP